MLKKHWKIFLDFFVIALVLIGVTTWYCVSQIDSLNADYIEAHKKPYKVEAGMNARIIADELTSGTYPKFIINLWLREHPELTSIQKGQYRIDGKKTLAQILQDMVQGKIVEEEYLQLGIVEGTNMAAVFANLKKILPKQYEAMHSVLTKPADFIIESLKNDQVLLEAIGGASNSLEGLLMPATYPVYHQGHPLETVASALRSTARFMAASWPDRDKDVWVKTPYEALIIASIIERETLVNDERPQVAAVFYNRLKKNMRLQTDPTVMYGISPAFSGRLSREQLRKDTPYNTYTRAGLPPTPISMPSKASILAALHPASSQALYFVAADVSPTQGHVFTNSLDDHNKAVASYRRKVKDYKNNHKNDATELKVDGDDNFRDLEAMEKNEPEAKTSSKQENVSGTKKAQELKKQGGQKQAISKQPIQKQMPSPKVTTQASSKQSGSQNQGKTAQVQIKKSSEQQNKATNSSKTNVSKESQKSGTDQAVKAQVLNSGTTLIDLNSAKTSLSKSNKN